MTTPITSAYHLAKNGPISLFWRRGVFYQAIDWLADHHYQLVRLDAGNWLAEADFHQAIAPALSFPDYYGHNLNAFNDCLRDVAEYLYGARRDATGTMLALSDYDAFAAREPNAAQAILDLFATQAHGAMLFGHRMLCLVQSNDPDIGFDDVGAAPAMWNPGESTRSNRR